MLKSFKSSIQGKIRSNALLLMLALAGTGFFGTSCSNSESGDDESGVSETENVEAPTEESKQIAEGKGIGPVKNLELPSTIDKDMASKGHELFETKCTPCHNSTDEKKVGPGLHTITKQRKPEWIMNMILNPSEMLQKDPAAKELLGEYIAQMANQSLSEEEARNVLEFLRENDSK